MSEIKNDTSNDASLIDTLLATQNKGLSFDEKIDPRPKAKLSDIIVRENRGRKNFENIQGLAQSLREHGMLNAVTLEPVPQNPLMDESLRNKFYLIAGERRFRAASLAGWTHVPYHLKRDIDLMEAKMLELIENKDRQPLEWHEEIELLAQIDKHRKDKFGLKPSKAPEDDPRWSTQKTAILTNTDYSSTIKKISFAEKLRKRPDLKDRIKHLNESQAMKVAEQIEKREDVERMHTQGLIKTAAEIKEMDAVVFLKSLPDSSIDLILTDGPFGYSEITKGEGKSRGGTQAYQSSLKPSDNLSSQEVLLLFREVIPEFARILRPGSHFYIFFALDFLHDFTLLCQSHGLQLHKQVLIWEKDNENTTPFNGYNYMSCYESILFGWKPEMKRLNSPMRSVLKYKTVREKDRRHPFHKPPELLSALIKNSTNLGEVVLDCFAGSGEVVKSAKNCGRSGIGCEVDHENWLGAQANLMDL
jgi:DNA modification methylase